jgi:hypothetical protein
LSIRPGHAKYIEPTFYKRNQSRIDEYVDAGVLRLEIPPAKRKQWRSEVASATLLSPSQVAKKKVEASVVATIVAEAEAAKKKALARAELKKAAAKSRAEALKADTPDISGAKSDVMNALDLLSGVPPAEMTDAQISRMESNQTAADEEELETIIIGEEPEPKPKRVPRRRRTAKADTEGEPKKKTTRRRKKTTKAQVVKKTED